MTRSGPYAAVVDAVKAANLALRFVLELAALAALGYWGAQAGPNAVTGVVLAVGTPLLAAVAWGLFVSPKRRVDVPVLRWVVELTVFGAAALGLVASGHRGLGAALLAVYTVNRALVSAWRQ